jgi:hypothetical protein
MQEIRRGALLLVPCSQDCLLTANLATRVSHCENCEPASIECGRGFEELAAGSRLASAQRLLIGPWLRMDQF